jgi:hypothetical protein
MVDISKCQGIKPCTSICEKKESCYRFTAPSTSRRQSYLLPHFKDDKCLDYWPIEEKKAL